MPFFRVISKATSKATLIAFLLISYHLNAQSQSTLVTSPTVENTDSEAPFKPTGKVLFQVFSRQVEDAFSKTNQGVTVIQPTITVKYGEYITLGLELVGLFGTGNASNFWNDDGKPPNSIVLNEAYAKINLLPTVFLKAGALKTPINPIMSILTPTGFIGAQEEWQIGHDNSNITLTAYQAIPSTGTVSRRVYDDGTQAYFLSQTIAGRWNAEATGTDFKIAATRFQFENLSTNVATDSYYTGNSLSAFEGIAKGVRFKHGFMGTESTAMVKQNVGKHEVSVYGSTINNDQAQVGKDKGQIVGGNVNLIFGNYAFKPAYAVFDYGADVTPNAYTTLIARYQNRIGHRIGFDMEMKKEKLFLRTTYVKLDMKDDNPYLADREVFNIAVEAKYDIF